MESGSERDFESLARVVGNLVERERVLDQGRRLTITKA